MSEQNRADLDRLGAVFSFMLAARLDAPASSSWRCSHVHAVPVRSVVDDELLARLCPDCDEQLPASGTDARVHYVLYHAS
ncbi:hypothetical protein ACLQ2R_03245 [Streptosporangium sp. DT93]|uniref:hypothetical protein n=1 Tax=Streptosporangium sp. DT93 TaxID=3393428 RepID=UPI003CF1CF43